MYPILSGASIASDLDMVLELVAKEIQLVSTADRKATSRKHVSAPQNALIAVNLTLPLTEAALHSRLSVK